MATNAYETTRTLLPRKRAIVGRRPPRRRTAARGYRPAGVLTRLPRTPIRRVAQCLALLVALETPLNALAALPRPVRVAAPAPVALEAPGILSTIVAALGSALASLGSSLLEVDAGGGTAEARGRAVAAILEVGGAGTLSSADTGLEEASEPESFDASAEETEVPASSLLEVVSGKSRTFGCASLTGCPEGTPPDGLPLADVPDELENEVFALARAGGATARLLPDGVAPGVAALDAVVSGSFAGVRCNDETQKLELVAPSGEAGASRIDAVVIGGSPVPLPGEVEPNTTIVTSDAPLVVLNEQRCGVDETTRVASCTTNALNGQLVSSGELVRLTLSSSFAEITVPEQCDLCLPLLTSSIKTGSVVAPDRVAFTVRVESSGCGPADDVVVTDRVPVGLTVDLTTVTIDDRPALPGTVTLGPCPEEVSFDGCPGEAPIDASRECLTVEAGDLPAGGSVEVAFEATVDPARCDTICNDAEIEVSGLSGPSSISRTAILEAPLAGVDGDGDGFSVCDGDCDDADAGRNPAAAEVCNGTDDDCDGAVDEDLGQTTCGRGACFKTVDNCVGGAPRICEPRAGARPETCDGLDNDCDGAVDEGLGETTCGTGVCRHAVRNCEGGIPRTCDPFAGAGPETCNGLDDDCDGAVDEELGQTTCGVGACARTVETCAQGEAQTCTQGTPSSEVCGNSVDEDCDGETDDADVCAPTCIAGGSCDTGLSSACAEGRVTCPAGPLGAPACEPLTAPEPETCNGLDDDCDGEIDEGTAEPAAARTYTVDADFDEGRLINVVHSTPDQLELSNAASAFNFIWVAVSSKGTIVKIDTDTGQVLSEYRTAPQGQPLDPSRTTVDLNGSVWATNRGGNSVVHVGLAENGQCIDRNGNGTIDTSGGLNDIRAWSNAGGADTNGGVTTAADECILHYVRTSSSGTRHVSITRDNDVWVSGTTTNAGRFDLIDGETGTILRSEGPVGFGGYGGLLDPNGVIWSARRLLRWDTALPLSGPNGTNWRGYTHDSYGLCIDPAGNVWNTQLSGNAIRRFAPDGTQTGSFAHGNSSAQGCAIDRNGHVWVAHSSSSTHVGHLRDDGTFVGNVTVGSGPTGVAVDGAGKIWATNHNSRTVSRIDPNLGPIGADGVTRVGLVDLTTVNLGGTLYNYSDMTGSTLSGAPDNGTWEVVLDSGIAGAEWGSVKWTQGVFGDGSLTVRAASSADGTTFGPPETATSGFDLSVADGRFLKVTVSFARASTGESPILFDLTASTASECIEFCDGIDNDGDGEVDEGLGQTTCGAGACEHTIDDCVAGVPQSCDPFAGAAPETCDGIDNDCNGAVDDLGQTTCGVGACARTVETCVNGTPQACTPGTPSPEVCGNLIDEDCDGQEEDPDVCDPSFIDDDGDGFTEQQGDCDDANPAIHPGATDIPGNGIDEDCSGADTPDSDTVDDDGDGFSESQGDCDDANPAVHPGATDVPGNGIDENCDGADADPGDFDDDGDGFTESQGDCDDTNPAIHPGATDTPGDGIDQDCNGADAVAGDTTPPTADIASPADLSIVTEPTDVTGTADDANFLRYRLELARVDDTTFTTIGSGTTRVVNGVLGRLDPTLLENGLYKVRLIAEDANGRTSTDEVVYLVEGEMKIGHFRLSFVDLSIPVSGIPITIVRTYDSRVKSKEDFGIGWTLDIGRGFFRNNRPPGQGWQIHPGRFFPCQVVDERQSHLTEVRLSDTEFYTFALTLTRPTALAGGCEATAAFRFIDGSTPGATLVPLDGTQVIYQNGDDKVLDPATAEVYDPVDVRLTTPDGRTIDLVRGGGIVRIKDLNGNELSIGPGGIVHSSGKSIAFTRDSLGRVTGITDPNGNTLGYTYDGRGDLIAFRDPLGHSTTFRYDGLHNLIEIVDPLGNRAVRGEYDADGRLVAVIDASGNRIALAHDLGARTETVTDRLGNVSTIEYDDRGNIVRRTDPLGNTATFTYDARGNQLSETDPLGNTRTYTYDTSDNVLTDTDALGNTTSYTYNARNQELTRTDPEGGRTSYSFDRNENLVTERDPLGRTTAHAYDSRGNRVSTTDPLGNRWTYSYDAAGNRIRTVDPLGNPVDRAFDPNGNVLSETSARVVAGGTQTIVRRFAYDARSQMIRTTDPEGAVSDVEFDAVGLVSSFTDPLGNKTSYVYDEEYRLLVTTFPDGTSAKLVYDAEGRTIERTDEAGRATQHLYDAVGRLISTVYADGAETRSSYDAVGRTSTMTDERGNLTAYTYDAAGRLIEAQDGLGNARAHGYDRNGNLRSTRDARGNIVSYEYDVANQPTRVRFPDGTMRETVFDEVGRVAAEIDQDGRQTSFGYDGAGRLVSVTDALGNTARYSYDAVGNLLSQTDAEGRVTEFEYDRVGRRTRRSLPAGQFEVLAFDQIGKLVRRTDFNGETTTYAYDSRNRLIGKHPDPRRGEADVSFTYNSTGQRATMVDAQGTTTYLYDARDRLVSRSTPQGTLAYTYDARGNLTGIRSATPSGVSLDYQYDARNRLATVVDNNANPGVTTYSYDPNGNLSAYTAPNGVSTSYSVDALNRLTDVVMVRDGIPIAEFHYTLGPAGNRLRVDEGNGRAVAYGYDALYRLTGETVTGDPNPQNNGSVTYTYDRVGNRLTQASTIPAIASATYAYDVNDRLAGETYDGEGNVLVSELRTFAYDFENRLKSVDGGTATFAYDGDGNRVGKTVAGVTTQYLVDDRNLTGFSQVLEESSGGTMQRRYSYGYDLLGLQATAETEPSFYGYDGHGSVRTVVDGRGNIVEEYFYDAFGNPLETPAATSNVYRYAGEQFDPELGLIYLRARHLDPRTGRFRGMDTHPGQRRDPRTLHKYLYAASSPVDNVDPSGHSFFSLSVSPALVGVLAGLAVAGIFFQNSGTQPGNVNVNDQLTNLRVARPKLLDAENEFFREFTAAARVHYGETGSNFSGGLNNLFSTVGLGEGCAAWQAWIMEWFKNEQERRKPKWDAIVLERVCSVSDTYLGEHHFVRANLPIRKEHILDPWRSIDVPIYTEGLYAATFDVVIHPRASPNCQGLFSHLQELGPSGPTPPSPILKGSL